MRRTGAGAIASRAICRASLGHSFILLRGAIPARKSERTCGKSLCRGRTQRCQGAPPQFCMTAGANAGWDKCEKIHRSSGA